MKPLRQISKILLFLLLLATSAPSASAFYDPTLGRWINRDPNEERGGVNLYSAVGNNLISRFDPFGLEADFREKLRAVCACGFEGAKAAKALADEATQEAQNRFTTGELHNGDGDAWRHCFWSCNMTRELGMDCAFGVGHAHENGNNRRGEQTREEYLMDVYNNMYGRDLAAQTGSCADLCQSAVDDARLTIITP